MRMLGEREREREREREPEDMSKLLVLFFFSHL